MTTSQLDLRSDVCEFDHLTPSSVLGSFWIATWVCLILRRSRGHGLHGKYEGGGGMLSDIKVS